MSVLKMVEYILSSKKVHPLALIFLQPNLPYRIPLVWVIEGSHFGCYHIVCSLWVIWPWFRNSIYKWDGLCSLWGLGWGWRNSYTVTKIYSGNWIIWTKMMSKCWFIWNDVMHNHLSKRGDTPCWYAECLWHNGTSLEWWENPGSCNWLWK